MVALVQFGHRGGPGFDRVGLGGGGAIECGDILRRPVGLDADEAVEGAGLVGIEQEPGVARCCATSTGC